MDARTLPRKERKLLARQLEKENRAFTERLTPIPLPQKTFMGSQKMPVAAYRSNSLLVQVFEASSAIKRLSVNRAAINVETGDWLDGISWDTLQRVKSELGFGEFDAVEVYPPDNDVVNVANIRHLFILSERLDFAWRSR